MPYISISFETRRIEVTDGQDPSDVVRQLASLASMIEGLAERHSLSGLVAGLLRSAKVIHVHAGHQGGGYSEGRASARLSVRVAEAWNQRHPIGAAVIVTRDSGREQVTHTSSRAGVSASGEAVVMLHGISGYYLLERVKPIEGGI